MANSNDHRDDLPEDESLADEVLEFLTPEPEQSEPPNGDQSVDESAEPLLFDELSDSTDEEDPLDTLMPESTLQAISGNDEPISETPVSEATEGSSPGEESALETVDWKSELTAPVEAEDADLDFIIENEDGTEFEIVLEGFDEDDQAAELEPADAEQADFVLQGSDAEAAQPTEAAVEGFNLDDDFDLEGVVAPPHQHDVEAANELVSGNEADDADLLLQVPGAAAVQPPEVSEDEFDLEAELDLDTVVAEPSDAGGVADESEFQFDIEDITESGSAGSASRCGRAGRDEHSGRHATGRERGG